MPRADDDAFLERIVAWAAARPDVRAAVLTGSRARRDGRVDEASDWDVELFTTDRDAYAGDAWLAGLGETWVDMAFPPDADDPYLMRLVVLAGGRKVDFGIAPPRVLERAVAAGRLNDLYERGYRVLLDRDGLAARLPAPSYAPPPRPPPGEEEFRAAVREFWFEASHIPKYLARGDLWVVKFRDWTMKELLLRMLEWHAVATHGERHDVRHIGTRMADWTAPETWERLHEVFGRFDAEDARRALLATASLYGELGRETAAALGYAYPSDLDEAIGRAIGARG